MAGRAPPVPPHLRINRRNPAAEAARLAQIRLAKQAFDVRVRQACMEYDATDLDRNRRLGFEEFSEMVRAREIGVHSEIALRRRFDEMDTDCSGSIEMAEFIKFTLIESLSRTSVPVAELMMSWDTNGDGELNKQEFRDAVRYFGFAARDDEIDAVFDDFDWNHNGVVDIKELELKLKPLPPPAANAIVPQSRGSKKTPLPPPEPRRHELRQLEDRDDQLTVEDMARLGQEAHATAETPRRDVFGNPIATNAADVRRGLIGFLTANGPRVMDLFRKWDSDGDG